MQNLAGRNGKSIEYDCKRAAQKLGIPVIYAQSVKSEQVYKDLSFFEPDYILALFFNQLVPKEICALAKKKALNIHPSFLPSYRGVSPCFWILAEGRPLAGVTVHELGDKLDGGEVVARLPVAVKKNDSVFTLYRRCARVAADLAVEVLVTGRGPVATLPIESSYRSSITCEAVRAFRRKKRRFFLFF